MSQNNLSDVDALAARMFFDVAMQAAFALEDPSLRFAQVFAHSDAIGPRVAKLADIPSAAYDTVVDNTDIIFQVKPPKSPALSRVLVQGGPRPLLMRFLEDAMETADYFTLESLGSAEPAEDLSGHSSDIGNFMYKLVINADLDTVHDVAVMFAWGLSSDKGTMMELSAWPIDK